MKMVEFSGYLQQLEKTASRNLMTEILVDLFTQATIGEARVMGYMTLGGLRPKFDRLETNLAEKMVIRGLASIFSTELKEVWTLYKKLGDLGGVAEQLRNQKPIRQAQGKPETRNLKTSVLEVYEKLEEIASENGTGSQERKLMKLTELIKRLDPLSIKYVVRMVVGKLRLGFSDMTLLDVMSVMDRGSKAARKEVERAYQVYPDVGELLALVKKDGVTGLEDKVAIKLGVPIVPALCQRLKTADEMIAKMGKVLVEPKFDGTRVQIHFSRAKNGVVTRNQKPIRQAQGKPETRNSQEFQVKTFSRTLDETTWMFPELQTIGEQITATEVILDGEAIGVDPKTGKWLPFQDTITRKRKYDIADVSARVPLAFMVFDVIYKDGKSLLKMPLVERRRLLEKVVQPGKILRVTEAILTDSPDKLREYHAKKLKEGLEGAVVKKADSVYEPGRRGWSWVKFKESETSQAKLSDTIDAVVMGFYRGRGKRAAFGIGAFLVGVRANSEILRQSGISHNARSAQDDSAAISSLATESIVTIAKIGTGLTDEQWRELRKRLEKAVAMEKPVRYRVPVGLVPDVWAEPEVVVEVAADEITRSPTHTAGLALRFPRLVRFRDDKDVESITTLEELKQIRMG